MRSIETGVLPLTHAREKSSVRLCEEVRRAQGHAMNGSGSAGIMASYNGFARHDSASAICTLAGGRDGSDGYGQGLRHASGQPTHSASLPIRQVLTAVSAHLRKSFTAAEVVCEPALKIILVK